MKTANSYLVLEKQAAGKIIISLVNQDGVESSLYNVLLVDDYYLVVEYLSQKTIKVCESEDLLFEFIETKYPNIELKIKK